MRILFIFCVFLSLSFGIELLKLSEFKDQNVSGWLASEKLDGVRAYWDGKNLLSRNGKILNAPSQFTANFPPFELDGELFIGRGKFQLVQSVVMDKAPNFQAWQAVKFHVFDVPNADGGLAKRLEILADFLQKNPNENIVIIEQIPVIDNDWFKKFASEIIASGGEGAVVREPNVAYERARSKNALKYKIFQDAECEVVGYVEGKGKFSGLMGSLVCQMPDKKRFKIGSGFTNAQRKDPPKIGEIVTYKFQNFTKKGLPRFPVFLRVRKD